MPRPAGEPGQLSVKDIYDNARYDAGYRMGWRDAHRKSRPSHRATREKYAEYAIGYAHGFNDGVEHPCPEWDEMHRTGPVGGRGLPLDCPWNQVGR